MRVLMKFPVPFSFSFPRSYLRSCARSFVVFVICASKNKIPENAPPDTLHRPSESNGKYRKKAVESAEIENMLARHARQQRVAGHVRRLAVEIVENIPCTLFDTVFVSFNRCIHTHTPPSHPLTSTRRATQWKCMPKIKRKYFMQTEVIIFPRKYSSLQFSVSSFFLCATLCRCFALRVVLGGFRILFSHFFLFLRFRELRRKGIAWVRGDRHAQGCQTYPFVEHGTCTSSGIRLAFL